jgi:hypothetical protein
MTDQSAMSSKLMLNPRHYTEVTTVTAHRFELILELELVLRKLTITIEPGATE